VTSSLRRTANYKIAHPVSAFFLSLTETAFMPVFSIRRSVAFVALAFAPAVYAQSMVPAPAARPASAAQMPPRPAAPIAVLSQSSAAPVTIKQVVERTLLTHPEIQARYHDFRSSLEGENVQAAGLLPTVDSRAYVGKEFRSGYPDRGSFNYNRPGFNVELRQLLFDGFRTSNLVKQAGYEKLSRYYDLLATSDDLAQQTTQAYLDLQRYRSMELLARQNYKLHEDTLGQIRERTQSGVGRGVDLEQAGGRLALAQTNLMTETANLIDVEQRFRRLTGMGQPGELLDTPELTPDLPIKPVDFVDAIRRNPSFLSKQALLQGANAGVAASKGNFSPRFDFVAATGRDRGENADYKNVQSSSVALQMTANLYRGGGDMARVRQTTNQAYAAHDVRDYTCRNVQQELAIAWNKILTLREQLPFLRDHEIATTKVRDAYRQQFRIDERSLLDLLNTENELFDSRRALTNGIYDLKLAEYRFLALSHRLLPTLALQPARDEMPEENKVLETSDEMIRICSSDVPDSNRLVPVQVHYNQGTLPPTLAPVATPDVSPDTGAVPLNAPTDPAARPAGW